MVPEEWNSRLRVLAMSCSTQRVLRQEEAQGVGESCRTTDTKRQAQDAVLQRERRDLLYMNCSIILRGDALF